MTKFKIFIVEDDPWYGEILKYHLSLNDSYDITLFTTAKECLDQLHQRPSLVTVDFHLPDMTGAELIQHIHSRNNTTPVIVISGQEDVGIAIQMLKKGASDYIVKDDHTKELLWNSVVRILENYSLKEEVAQLKEELGHKYAFQKTLIGESPALKKTFGLIEKAIGSNINVSISGETGTGKEVVAKAIHFNSERRKKPFVAINMAAIPPDLAESELFGHEKGSFTGAISSKIGKFEEAQGGTLFLDEIAEMDLQLQSKLLRALQEREITRVGGNQVVKLDTRLVVASHKNLAAEVSQGNFREDLYYRIIGLPIELPPLRERGKDIILLSRFFVTQYTKENAVSELHLTPAACEKLMAYSFPGNVRELKSIIDLACVMCDGKSIVEEDIRFIAIRDNGIHTTTEKTLEDYNIDIIKSFLNRYDGNVVKVSEKLDISKSKIYAMIKSGVIVI